MPTEKAHGAQIAKTCEAFVHEGASIELVVPRRATPIAETPQEYYSLKRQFPITRVWVLDVVSSGRLGFWIETLTFILSTFWYLCGKEGVIYGRDEFVLYVLAHLGYLVVWESHTGAWNSAARYLLRRARLTVVISGGLKKLYVGVS